MKFLILMLLAPLSITTAYAQTASPTPDANKTQSPSIAPSVNPVVPTPSSTTAATPLTGNHFINNQATDQWLVGNLWNKRVYNVSGQSIGDLKDVLIDRDGKVSAILIGVGGFLGLGEKNVAVDFDYLKQNGGITGDRIVLGMNEQDLRAAPDFQRIKPSAAVTATSVVKTQ